MKKQKQYIIPIFVPHLGCPNDCTFCNQRKISGQLKNVTENDVRDTIEFYLKNFKEKNSYIEVAFYGGSFTGIDVEIQEKLLQTAYEYVKNMDADFICILGTTSLITDFKKQPFFPISICKRRKR